MRTGHSAFSRQLVVAGVIAAISLPSLVGCAPRDDGRANVMPRSAAMELDPTNMVELPPWFSNGEITLAFDSSGMYRMYEGLNRHAAPIERGRWVRVNYASVQLEPYAVGRDATPVRGILELEDGELMLNLPRTKPLRGLAGPPQVIEDELFGQWSSDDESLELRRDMRFSYRGDDGPNAAPLLGRWHVEGQHLILRPEAPSASAKEYAIRRGENGITLEVNGRTLERAR